MTEIEVSMIQPLALKMEGDHGLGMWEASRRGKGNELDSPLELPKRNAALLTP